MATKAAAQTRHVPYEETAEDERFRELTNLCWGYVPLTTAIVFAIEDEAGNLIASGEIGQTEFDEATCLLFGDSVHPDHRGLGLHKRLIDERIAYARSLGSRRCVATTYGRHTVSAHNFRRAGFRQEAWIPDGPAEHQTEWVLDLTPSPTL